MLSQSAVFFRRKFLEDEMGDHMHFLLIALEVCEVTSAKPNLPEPCRLIDHVTDDDRREGIRRYFAEEKISQRDVELMLLAYKDWERQQALLHGIAASVVMRVLG
jgi:hypothetical protein